MVYTLPDISGTGVAVQVSVLAGESVRWIQVSAGLANSGVDSTGAQCCRVGDVNTSSSRGIQIAPGAGQLFPLDGADPTAKYSLAGVWVFIPNGDKVQVCYGD